MKKYLSLILKVTIAAVLLKIVSKTINWHDLVDIVYTSHGIAAIACCTLLLIAQHLVAGVKAWMLSQNTITPISISNATKGVFISFFVSQFGLTFISGDVVRGWYLYKKYANLRNVSAVIFTDRVTGFVGLTALYLLAMIGLTALIPDKHTLLVLWGIGLLCVTMIVGYVVLLLLPLKFLSKYLAFFSNFLATNKEIFVTRKNLMLIIFLGVAVNYFNVLAIAGIGNLLGADLPLTSYFSIAVPALLLSMLPITVSGWGIRETALLAGFALLDVPGSMALATSIVYGISQLIAALPGALFVIGIKNVAPVLQTN